MESVARATVKQILLASQDGCLRLESTSKYGESAEDFIGICAVGKLREAHAFIMTHPRTLLRGSKR